MYDDAPEEFLDPLMSTLMANPVELPSSRTVIDYITISKTQFSINLYSYLRETSNERT